MSFTQLPAELYDGIGILGVVFYMGSYAALQFGLLRGRGYAYPMLNALAASCVLISLIDSFNLSSLLIQISWIVISAYGISRLYYLRKHNRYSEEEQNFLDIILPDLPKEFGRKFLNTGEWRYGNEGEILIQEGLPTQNLIFMANGSAKVSLGEKLIANIRKPVLFGEITCLNGDPATASVLLIKRSRLLMINVDKLKKLLDKEPEILHHLERSFKSSLSRKLRDASQKVVVQNRVLQSIKAG